MNDSSRKVLDKSFTGLAFSALAVMGAAVCLFLLPIIINGSGAVFFRATVEHWKFLSENLDYELSDSVKARIAQADEARAPLWKMMENFEKGGVATEKILDAKLEKSLSKISENSSALRDILSKENPVRAKLLEEFSRTLWSEYLNAAKTEYESGRTSAFVLEKIFLRENESLSESVKAKIADFEKGGKLKFTVRQQFRRALCAPVRRQLEYYSEKLHSENVAYAAFKKGVEELLGPSSAAEKETLQLMRQKYGQPRMDLAEEVFEKSVLNISIRQKNADGAEISKRVQSAEYFKKTEVAAMLDYMRKNFDKMFMPKFTAYWGFFFDDPYDSNIFGGIWPMILGTFYLTAGSMIIAAPLGIFAAIYFSEYAKAGRLVSALQMCVGTLAGVPSIVFGLFGLAFLINTLKISDSKSVLAGAITLALLILPTIIRSCEEALKAVPRSYREAAFGLGAGKWKAICSVILPAALPSMLTGIIISMGRAAGETAPIIFTAATSAGAALALGDVFSQPTPALPWNIYNICSEHEMAERVAHVQYGMVLTLIGIVLALNFAAIFIRAKLQKKMKA